MPSTVHLQRDQAVSQWLGHTNCLISRRSGTVAVVSRGVCYSSGRLQTMVASPIRSLSPHRSLQVTAQAQKLERRLEQIISAKGTSLQMADRYSLRAHGQIYWQDQEAPLKGFTFPPQTCAHVQEFGREISCTMLRAPLITGPAQNRCQTAAARACWAYKLSADLCGAVLSGDSG